MFRMDLSSRDTRLTAPAATALGMLCLVAVTVSALAQTPASLPAAAPAPVAAPAAPAPAATAAVTAPAAVATEQDAPFQIPPGWRPKTVKGEELYCKKTPVTGSRFGTDVCMTLSQLEQHERNNAEMRDRMRQSFRVCSGGSSCANN